MWMQMKSKLKPEHNTYNEKFPFFLSSAPSKVHSSSHSRKFAFRYFALRFEPWIVTFFIPFFSSQSEFFHNMICFFYSVFLLLCYIILFVRCMIWTTNIFYGTESNEMKTQLITWLIYLEHDKYRTIIKNENPEIISTFISIFVVVLFTFFRCFCDGHIARKVTLVR